MVQLIIQPGSQITTTSIEYLVSTITSYGLSDLISIRITIKIK
jgi:hypothetical protein